MVAPPASVVRGGNAMCTAAPVRSDELLASLASRRDSVPIENGGIASLTLAVCCASMFSYQVQSLMS